MWIFFPSKFRWHKGYLALAMVFNLLLSNLTAVTNAKKHLCQWNSCGYFFQFATFSCKLEPRPKVSKLFCQWLGGDRFSNAITRCLFVNIIKCFRYNYFMEKNKNFLNYSSQMTATEQWIFLCAAHKTPKECPAIDYTRHTLDGAACLLNSNKYFPSRVSIKVKIYLF